MTSWVRRGAAAAVFLGLALASPQVHGVAHADEVAPGRESTGRPAVRADAQGRTRTPDGLASPASETGLAGSARVTLSRRTTRSDQPPEISPVPAAMPRRVMARSVDSRAEVVSLPVPAPPPESVAAAEREAMRPVAPDVPNPPGGPADARAGGGPVRPVSDPMSSTVLAAAARETFAGTTRLADPASVVAIPQTALVSALRLQEIPVLGPLLVTPSVTLVNRIPVVSDVLHPIFGYPLLPQGLAAPRDVRVVSFDGTQINVHFMPAAGLPSGQSAPTVFLAPALGMPGATNLDGTPLDLILADLGSEIGVGALRKAGYNVVTWDPRGTYLSGGALQIDSPEYEARDVSAIISWVAQQAETQLDAPDDPRMGMAGASYGGGIQLVTAATDHRVDAIVPVLSWNTLNSSLYKSGAFKTGGASALAATLVLTLTRMNPRIIPMVVYGDFTGEMTAAGQDLLARSGPGPARGFPDLVGRISAPTLLIQGTVDTLTTLKEADITAEALMARSVPTKVLWFCGGHGVCIHNVFDLSDGALLVQRTVEWLNRYVKGSAEPTGPTLEWVDQRGRHLGTETYPAPVAAPLIAALDGGRVLPLVPFVGGSGPMFLVLPVGGTKAFNAVNLTTPVAATTTYIAGEPTLTLSYSGTGTGDHVYAQLLDDTTGLVIGNQVTPIPVTLDGRPHTTSVPLEMIAHTLNPGETLTVQLLAWSAAHAASWSLGTLTVNDMRITLPTTPDPIDIPHPLGVG